MHAFDPIVQDPRFIALQQFALQRPEVAADPVFKLVNQLFNVAPGVLTEHGKTKVCCLHTSTLLFTLF